ncbi:ASCH domain-containing protein [Jeotgalibacillus proteolyticus]|uniref:ASCH domain-containing protein n=1 Tax=Jeotgalibacillus proteolyticus TaxID=2082395 RepID=A0A2S5GBJ1_9BACL|nr:ASCH domain-containing protein [Jeotgalibacillus proteolyticus]PPA70359.1 hypothetical protein C4B60_12335 [Jeotgalibacillus proteolyticus]
MKHKMGLYDGPFKSIQENKKEFEVRLNDEKRRKISIGDVIEFVKVPENGEAIKAEVLGLRNYKTFEEMYKDIPFTLFDCEGWTMEEMIEGTYEIYTQEQERKWGTLAIQIKVLN